MNEVFHAPYPLRRVTSRAACPSRATHVRSVQAGDVEPGGGNLSPPTSFGSPHALIPLRLVVCGLADNVEEIADNALGR